MPDYKTGERLKSLVSDAQFVVVRAQAGTDELMCDGHALVREGDAVETGRSSSEGPEVRIGKRYEDEDSAIELLCVAGGRGTLTLGDRPLRIKAPKPLPASD